MFSLSLKIMQCIACSQVSIGHIVAGGAADLDGRLCTGDEIVYVNSQSVLSTSHHHVVQLMGQAATNGRVTLGIRRRIPTQGNLPCLMKVQRDMKIYNVYMESVYFMRSEVVMVV